MEEAGTSLQSIEDCISVLQGDLHQPGTPAVVLKLASSWKKMKTFLTSTSLQIHQEQGRDSDYSVAMVKDDPCSLQAVTFKQETLTSYEYMERVVCAREEQDCSLEGMTGANSAIINTCESNVEQMDFHSETPVPMTENGKELGTELPAVTSPGLLYDSRINCR